MNYFSLNRFEDKFALLEDDKQKMCKLKRSLLPKNAKEGDVFFKRNEKFIFDKNETLARRQKNIKLMDDVLKK